MLCTLNARGRPSIHACGADKALGVQILVIAVKASHAIIVAINTHEPEVGPTCSKDLSTQM